LLLQQPLFETTKWAPDGMSTPVANLLICMVGAEGRNALAPISLREIVTVDG
jgi:hypothetical protein